MSATTPRCLPCCFMRPAASGIWKGWRSRHGRCCVTFFIDMTGPLNPKEKLLRLLAEHSFKLGEFKLSSGGTSDYYIDCRTTTLHADGARLVGQVVSDVIN